MRAEDLARTLHARRSGHGKWRAKCPVHRSKGLTLAIYSDPDRVGLHCHAGCSKDDVLAALGLTWKDTLYQPRQKLDAKAWMDAQRSREAEEARKANIRIGELVLRFCEQGYTAEDRRNDVRTVLACAWVLSNKQVTQWERLMRHHLERIRAADHCRMRGMLPNS